MNGGCVVVYKPHPSHPFTKPRSMVYETAHAAWTTNFRHIKKNQYLQDEGVDCSSRHMRTLVYDLLNVPNGVPYVPSVPMKFPRGLSMQKFLCSQWKTLSPQTTTKGSCSLWHCHHDIQASFTNSKTRHGTRQFGTPFEAPNDLSWPMLNWIANDFSVRLGCGHLQVGVASKWFFSQGKKALWYLIS